MRGAPQALPLVLRLCSDEPHRKIIFGGIVQGVANPVAKRATLDLGFGPLRWEAANNTQASGRALRCFTQIDYGATKIPRLETVLTRPQTTKPPTRCPFGRTRVPGQDRSGQEHCSFIYRTVSTFNRTGCLRSCWWNAGGTARSALPDISLPRTMIQFVHIVCELL